MENAKMMDKWVSLKSAIVLVLIAVLIASGVTYVLAVSPSSTFTVSPGVFPGAPSFTVWREGDNYFAKNANGAIEYSGTNLATVIESAWSTLSTGGLILLKGNLELESPLTLTITNRDKLLILKGEGLKSTFIRWRQIGTAITINSGDPVDAIGWDMFKIEDFTIDCGDGTEPLEGDKTIGNGKTGRNAINIYRTGKIGQINNVWIRYADVGIKINDTNCVYVGQVVLEHCKTGIQTLKGTISYANAIYISNSKFTFCDKAIDLGSGVSQVVDSCAIEINNYGVYASAVAEILALRIYNNHFESDTNYDICLEGSWIDTVSIDSSYFFANASNPNSYAIKLDKVAYININNVFSQNHATAFIQTTTNTGAILMQNCHILDPAIMAPYSKLAKNSGTATISASTSVVVTHGLAGTPTVVMVTSRQTGYGTIAVIARGSTTFTITVTTSGTYDIDWYAEYKP